MVGNIDISSYYHIPTIEEYNHYMTYTPQQNENSIRIMVDRPNTKISIYRGEITDNAEPITTSFGYNNGQGELLIVRGLKAGQKYTFEFTFSLVENYEDFEKEPC